MVVAVASAVTEFRRRAFLRAVVTWSSDSDDPLLAWKEHPAIWDVYEDEKDLLETLQQHWLDLLSKRIYAQPKYPLGADRVSEVYTELIAENPVLRSILAGRQDDEAIMDAVQDEQVLLARAAGHLGPASYATLSWRGRDLLGKIPAQRRADG